jgi:hypothetical protein
VEFLESRLVLSTIIVPNPGNLPGYLPDGISFDAATGVLGIKGGSNDDKAAVSIVGNQVKATLDYPQYLPGPKGLPGTTLMLHSEGSYDSSLVKQIVFYGLDGADEFVNNTAITSTAYGGNGDDHLVGGSTKDVLSGQAGNDTLEGGGGDDLLDGGTGNDTYVFSGSNLGSDTLTEGASADNDTLDFSKFETNLLHPAIGPVPGITLDLKSTTQQTLSPDLKLTLSDPTAIETVLGSPFDDLIKANDSGDWLYGQAGNDRLFGGMGVDHLDGGDGNDTLVAIGGNRDTLTGGFGSDAFWCDKEPTEVITDASTAEITARHIHRVATFYTLKTVNGNSVTTQSFSRDLTGGNLLDPIPTSPGYTTHNFSSDPLFASAGPTQDDIFQGNVGDCYFLSYLAAIAQTNPDRIRQMVADLGDGTYAVHFFDAKANDVFVRVDADLPSYGFGSPVYAGLGQQNSLWVAIVEKAWAFYRNNMGTYASIDGGNNPGIASDVAFGTLCNPAPNDPAVYATAADYLNGIQAALAAKKAVTIGAVPDLSPNTPKQKTNDDSSTWHRGKHIYTVETVNYSHGVPISITLRNPNGSYVTVSADLIFYVSGGFAAFDVGL